MKPFSFEDVWDAYKECLKTKRRKNSSIKFSQNDIIEVYKLMDEINSKTYKIGKSITFVVTYPIYREVFAADFRDRIVHHLVMRELIDIFEGEFISESFACRKDKGVFCGVEKAYELIKKCSENYTKDVYIGKFDFKSFFMSINKEILAELVDKLIVRKYHDDNKKETIRWLCKKIILHCPQDNCERRGDLKRWDILPKRKSLFHTPRHKGLAIGNLTSQIFANYYLHFIDEYIMQVLGFRYYCRYMDDFLIIHEDKEKILEAIPYIERFAQEKLDITLHKDKRYIQHYSKGVKFIGAVLKIGRKYIINRTWGNLITKWMTRYKNVNKDRIDDFIATTNSYLGAMSHYSTFNLRKKIFNEFIADGWRELVDIDLNFNKVTKKDVKPPMSIFDI